jgi:diaminohydroxyphosphoribosylaminopyrimidine deaminase/5-amino-6-(5-phosphoribosylamino)uracil reductase
MTKFYPTDIAYMQTALMLARRGLGNCAPNPTVGCIIVKNGRVVGRGNTAAGGRPHAETIGLEMAGADAQGATAYVTLEPCSHYGKTPPCATALIEAGVARVVVACTDPNPKVNGAGIKMLKDAGIEVISGVCEAEALVLNRGFFKRICCGVPEVTLKIATTQDGSFTHPSQRWITGEAARQFVHLMRAQHDAILTGIGTVLADDPRLDCRLAGLEDRSPIRVLLDSHLRLPENARIAREGLHLLTTQGAMEALQEKVKTLEGKGIKLVVVDMQNGRPDIVSALKYLAGEGINRLMVEAGPILSQAFIGSDLVDNLYWFKAPILAANQSRMPDTASLTLKEKRFFEKDTLDIYETSN